MTASGTAEPTDFDLLARWRGGDQGSGNLLFERHYTSVRRFFDLRLNRLSEDLTQRTFLACVEQRDRGPHTSFRAYLFGIARNLLYGHYRNYGQGFDPLTSSTHVMMVEQRSPADAMAEKEEQRLLLRRLQRLPLDLQTLLQLAYWATGSRSRTKNSPRCSSFRWARSRAASERLARSWTRCWTPSPRIRSCSDRRASRSTPGRRKPGSSSRLKNLELGAKAGLSGRIASAGRGVVRAGSTC